MVAIGILLGLMCLMLVGCYVGLIFLSKPYIEEEESED